MVASLLDANFVPAAGQATLMNFLILIFFIDKKLY
jgi:hypothetical protein